MHDSEGKNLGFGFVCFKHPESAAKALLDINGQEGLYVKPALKKEQRQMEVRVASEKFKKSMQKFNLYVKNFPLDSTEEELKEHFAKFGPVNNVKIVRQPAAASSEESKEESKSLGFGFVSFATTDAAARAKLESKTQTFKGVFLYVAQFESKEVRKAHLAEMRDKKQLDHYKKTQAMHCFQSMGSSGLSQNLNQGLQGITWLQVIQLALALRNID